MDDVSSATYKIAQHGQIGETYHISSNQIISIKDLVRKICKLIKVQYKDIVEETEDRLGKDQSYLLDSDKLRNKLKWSEEKDLDYGLNETLIWIDQNLHTLKSMPMDYQHKKYYHLYLDRQ